MSPNFSDQRKESAMTTQARHQETQMHPSNPTIPHGRVRRALLGAAWAAAALGASTPSTAQDYPGKPVTIIVPFAAGGTVDKVARQIQQELAGRLGQSIIIDNRGGAGGTIGTALVAKAAADGYTLGMVFDSYATEQHM